MRTSDSALRSLWSAVLFALCLSPASHAQQSGTTGQIDLLYIRGEWGDKTMALTDAEWQTRLTDINTFAETYWTYHSSGAITSFAGTITARLQMAGPAPTSANPGDPGAIGTEMVALAQAAGFNLNDYDHLVLSYPSVAHTYSFGALGTPGRVWIPGSNPWGPGFVHEMGHAFAVGHASHWEGGAAILPGVHREGRDGLFMEGSEGGPTPIPPLNIGRSTINMPMRYKMGHVGNENIQFMSSSAVVRLYEFELPTVPAGKMLAARIPVGGTVPGDWWISFCPTMVDRWAAYNSGGFANGVIVHQFSGEITRSLDFTPQSQGGIGTNEEDYVDSRDGALTIGNSFTFPGTDVTIEPLQTGTTDGLRWIEVEIDLGSQAGPLFLREEFEDYAMGSSLATSTTSGQTGQGLGESGDWALQGTNATWTIAPGLSGPKGLAVNGGSGDGDVKITHTTPGWGSGIFWMSYLYRESSYGGHLYASGGGGFSGAFGHPWSRKWAINNAGNSVGYNYGQTYRLVLKIDNEAGTETMWVDPPIGAEPNPVTAVAQKNETQGSSPVLILRSHNTDGVFDDIRIGRTFDSIVGVTPALSLDPDLGVADSLFGDLTGLGIDPGPVQRTLAIQNTGVIDDLVISSLGITGPHSSLYTLTPLAPGEDVIAPGDQTDLVVTYHGGGPGTVEAALEFNTNDRANSHVVVSLDATVIPRTSFATWAATNGASANPGEDSNNNGVPNGVEFFMGGTLASPATLPPLVDQGSGVYTWTIPYDVFADADWMFQTSGDLASWSDFQEGNPEIQILTSPDRIQLTLPPAGSAGRLFYRLAVTVP